MKNDFQRVQALSEEAMDLFGRELFSMPVIPTDASDEDLLRELKYLEQNVDNKAHRILITSISHLSRSVKLELLHLIASLTMTAKMNSNIQQGGDDDKIVEYDEEVPERENNNYLSNTQLFISIVGLFIGLTLLYLAHSNINALKINYTIEIPGGFLSLFTKPAKTTGTLVNNVLLNIVTRAEEEIKFQTTRCFTADNSWVSNTIQALWNPEGVAKCVINTSLETAHIEGKRIAGEVSNTCYFIKWCLFIGTGMVSTFGARTFYIIDGRNDHKISNFIKKTIKLVPGIKYLFSKSEQILAIEDDDDTPKLRRSNRLRKTTRKGRKIFR